jgi:hypothetical protein
MWIFWCNQEPKRSLQKAIDISGELKPINLRGADIKMPGEEAIYQGDKSSLLSRRGS